MVITWLIVGLLGSVVHGASFGISTQPSSVTVEKEKSFTLNCVAANGVNTQYQWYMETSIPNKYMTTKVSGATESSLTVDQAAVGNGGFYQCKATSGGNVLYSDVAKVTVEYFNTIVATTYQAEIKTSTESVRYVLSCDLPDSSSNPVSSVKWYKDGNEISSSNMMIMRSSGTIRVESLNDLSVKANSLVLFNIKSSFAGTYTCQATVNSGVVSMKTQTVAIHEITVVKEFPDIDYVAQDISVTGASASSGDTVTVYCGTIGYLTTNGGQIPAYTWYATNGAVVELTENLSDYGRTMVLHGVSVSHSYTCKACLGGNCSSKIVTITVSAATPGIDFTTAPASYHLYEDGVTEGHLELTCKTNLGEGNWMKDGVSVEFPISKPKSTNSGYYQCYASTSDSWESRVTQVVVTEALTITLSVPSELDSDTAGTITCTTSGYPTPTVAFTKLDVNDNTVVIENCYSSDSTTNGCVRKNGEQYLISVDNSDLTSSGTYICTASQTFQKNGADMVRSKEASAALAIVKDVSVYHLGADSNNLIYGTSATFTCKVTGGRAPYKVQIKYGDTEILTWNKDGDNSGRGDCTGDYDKTCLGEVTSVVYGMEGDVTCNAWNTAKEGDTKTASKTYETIVTRPVTVAVTGDFFPVVGDNLVLTCNHYEKPYSFSPELVAWKFKEKAKNEYETVVPDEAVTTSDDSNYQGSVVATFNSVASTNKGFYACTSETVSSPGVTVYVDTAEQPSRPKLTIPDGIIGTAMNLTCKSEGYPPPALAWTIYANTTVANQTFVTKVDHKSTLVFQWTPHEAVEMSISCTASDGNANHTIAQSAVLTVISSDMQLDKSLQSSELVAIIVASIIGGIILFICIVFLVICICKERRRRKYDHDGSLEQGPPSKLEQKCLLGCIACCPCCFRSEQKEKKVIPRAPENKWRFPTLPKFNFSFITTEKVETPPKKPTKVERARRSLKSSVKRLSQRDRIRDSPMTSRKDNTYPPRRSGRGGGRGSESKKSPFSRHRKIVSNKKVDEQDSPIAIRISNFLSSPFVQFDEKEQVYKRTLSTTHKPYDL